MFRRLVTECVIATDLAKSMSWISTSRIAFQDWMRNNKFIPMNVNMDVSNPVEVVVDENLKLEREKKNLEYKILLMQLSIKCADVGHPARYIFIPFFIYFSFHFIFRHYDYINLLVFSYLIFSNHFQ